LAELSGNTRSSWSIANARHAIVQLDEVVRVPTNIVECPPEDVRVDMPVVAVFDHVSPEWTLMKFRPA
jgi:uncharacterized OB-fold protein